MSQILIVEDELHLASGLRFNFEAEGHQVVTLENGEDAVELLLNNPRTFDAVVLDVMLPGNDGFWVVSELRQRNILVPVLILTARGRSEDVLKGFESGADDYLAKPFDLSILMARLRSLLRRTEWVKRTGTASAEPAETRVEEPVVLNIAGKTVDFSRLELRAGDEVIHLTVMEAELLALLVRNAGRPVSRKQILEEVWGLREDTDTRAIDNFIVRLRRYLEQDQSSPRHLLTVRGVGYRFVAEDEQ